jgi:hypothetical protein
VSRSERTSSHYFRELALPRCARVEMAPIFRQDVKGGGGATHTRAGVGGAEDARRGGGVKSWGTPTGKSPDYFTDCRRGLR